MTIWAYFGHAPKANGDLLDPDPFTLYLCPGLPARLLHRAKLPIPDLDLRTGQNATNGGGVPGANPLN